MTPPKAYPYHIGIEIECSPSYLAARLGMDLESLSFTGKTFQKVLLAFANDHLTTVFTNRLVAARIMLTMSVCVFQRTQHRKLLAFLRPRTKLVSHQLL